MYRTSNGVLCGSFASLVSMLTCSCRFGRFGVSVLSFEWVSRPWPHLMCSDVFHVRSSYLHVRAYG